MIELSFEHIISIHGAPRSGTTWLGQIFDSSPMVRYKYQPLFSYAFKDQINLKKNKDEILEFYETLYDYKEEFLDQVLQKEKGISPTFDRKDISPKFLVTKMVRYHFLIPHFLNVIPNIKIVGIVRHPCGVLNSWKNASREFNHQQWDFNKEWRFGQCRNHFRPEEYFGFHRWKECTKMFLEMEKKHPKNFKLIQYEDLVQKPLDNVKDLFDFCDLKLEQQTIDFIKDSTTLVKEDTYSVFKGQKDTKDWESHLNFSIVQDVIKELQGTEFQRFI